MNYHAPIHRGLRLALALFALLGVAGGVPGATRARPAAPQAVVPAAVSVPENEPNNLFTQANNAFVGQVDPNTNNVKDGVVQIHYNIQALATFDITPCTMNNGQSSCA